MTAYRLDPDTLARLRGRAIDFYGNRPGEHVPVMAIDLVTLLDGYAPDAAAEWEEAARHALRWQHAHDEAQERIAAALDLIDYALWIRMYGERPPGHDDLTWATWDRRAEAFMREERALTDAGDDAPTTTED